MLIKQQLDYTKNLTQCFANIDASIAHLDEQFKRIQKRARKSEIVMNFVYSELHELRRKIDNLADNFTAEKKH